MQLWYGFHICHVYLFYFVIFTDTGANGFNGSGYLTCQGTQKPPNNSNMSSKSASTTIMVAIIVGVVVVFG